MALMYKRRARLCEIIRVRDKSEKHPNPYISFAAGRRSKAFDELAKARWSRTDYGSLDGDELGEEKAFYERTRKIEIVMYKEASEKSGWPVFKIDGKKGNKQGVLHLYLKKRDDLRNVYHVLKGDLASSALFEIKVLSKKARWGDKIRIVIEKLRSDSVY